MPTDPSPPPVLAIGLGRGRTGKSTLLRWAIGRALEAGREVDAADGDRHNATLAAFCRTAARPPSAEDADSKDWLTDRLNALATERRSLVLDLGGGDRLLADYGRDLALVEFCRDCGVEPLALLCLGPALDDLAHVVALADAFAPPRTVLVLNEGLVPGGRSAQQAFAPLYGRKEFAALVDRGAVPVLMPRLACMPEVDARRLGFGAARDGAKGRDGSPLGPVQRSQVGTWMRRMEEAFEPCRAWLP